MKPIDRVPGFGPVRTEQKIDDNLYKVTVAPPKIFGGGAPQTLELNADQFARYKAWRAGGPLIQEALPDLTSVQREILMTGYSPEKQEEIFSNEAKTN